MKRHVHAVASPVFVALLFVAFGASLAGAASQAPTPSPVTQDLREQIHRDGWGRVLVQLRTPAARAHVPEGTLASQAAVAIQRADILSAQGKVLTKLGATGHRVVHRYQSVPYLALEVGPDALRELEAAGFDVARVVQDQVVFPMLPGSVPLIQADQVWARGYDGTGVVIAMIDTGVSPSHQFLSGKVVDEACFSSGASLCPRGGAQEVGPGSGSMCVLPNECEHGTMTSGVAAGNGAGAGVSFSGAARGAKIASYQVFSSFDCGHDEPCIGAYESDLIAALERVLSLRTTYNFAAVNMSLGGGQYTSNCDDSPLKPVIDNLRSFGIATVVATGNDSRRDAIAYPSCISSAISVGSTFKSGTIDTFWTNAAPFMTFFAPGVSILTSWIDEMFVDTFPLFAESSGTSLATPHVSGAWAVLKQAMPGASVDDIVTALQATGKPVTDTRSGGTVTKPLIQVEAALDRLLGPTGPLLTKLTPAGAVAGGPAFTLTADGGNFASGSMLLVNGVARPTTFVSATQLQASIPASDVAALGSASVSVRNSDGRVSNAVVLPISAGPCLTGQYFAEYFSNDALGAPATRTACEIPGNEWEPFIRANYGPASPDGLPNDNFSVRWTGRFPFAEGDYLFRGRTAEVANGLRIYVDGVLVVDVPQAKVFFTATRHMTAALHEVRIEFQDHGGFSGLRAEWFHLTADQPSVTHLVPAVVTAGGPAFTLTAEGTGFRPGATMFWDGVALPTTVTSDARLSANVPAVDIAAPGAAWITIQNADGRHTFGQALPITDPAATAPTLMALTPDGAMSGDPSFTMTVDGTKFAPGAAVLWAGAPRPTTFVSATRLTASISADDVKFPNRFQVTVRNPDGQASNGVTFFINLKPTPPPTLTALTPSTATAGSPGFTLTVDGTNFSPDDFSLFWNGSFRVSRFVSSTRLTADIPASDLAVGGTFPVDLRMATTAQASNRLNFTVTGGSTAVALSALTPSTATAGGPAFTLAADGANFVSGATVLWNGASRTTTFVSASRVTASIPASDIAAAGSASVAVRNPDLTVSNSRTFTIAEPPPLVVRFDSPAEGTTVSGTTQVFMSETGANGTPIAFTLTLDGAQVGSSTGTGTGFIYNWETSKSPNGPHALVVTVRDGAGRTATATLHVTVTGGGQGPTTTALTPNTAVAGAAGFTLTVDGTNFVSGATVLWNGAARTTTFVSATRVTASIAAADIAAAGSASVTVRNPDSQVSNAQTFTITAASPAPTLASLTPSAATAGSGPFTLTVDGTNFVSGSMVLWNGAARTTTFESSTRLTAYIMAPDTQAAASVPVTVRNPDLSVSNARTFTITPPPLVASFTSPAEGAAVNGTVTVGMSETGASGTPIVFTLTADGAQLYTSSGTATTASFNWNTAGYSLGSHVLGLTVRDGAGRTATATRNVTVTSSGTLRVAITQPGADGASVNGVTWFVLWVDGAAAGTKTYTLSVGGATVATTADTASGPISMAWDTRAVNDGSTTVIASARDASVNTGSAARVVNVQNGPPPFVASFTCPPEGAIVSGTVSVCMSAAGGTGTMTYTLMIDGAQVFTTATAAGSVWWDWNAAGYPAGPHRLSLTVRDGAGHTANATRDVTVGPSPLTAGITIPDEGATVSGIVTVGMVESGGTGTITWTLRLDGGATPLFTTSGTATTSSFRWDSNSVPAGPHQLQLTVQDGGGRTATATRNFTVATPPSFTAAFTSPGEGATVSGTVVVGMSETGGSGTISWTLRLDGGATPIFTTSGTATTASFNWDTSAVPPGPHRFDLTVQDGGGRTATATRNVTVPAPPPLTAAFTAPAEGATVSGPVTVGMSETGGQGTIAWTLRLDGGATPIFTTSGPASAASFNWDASPVPPGAHRLDLTVQDGAGRTATATRNVTVASAGTISVFITQPAEGATIDAATTGTVWFTIWIENAAAGSRTFTLSIDGAVVATTSSTSNGPISMPWTVGTAASGPHTATVSVRDTANNTGSANRGLTVTNGSGPAPLVASFTSPAEGATLSGVVTVGLSETGGTGTISWTVRLDGGATPIYTTSGTAGTVSFNWDTAAVAPGAHRLDLTVQDGSGRTATAMRNVTVAPPPPLTAAFTSPAESATVSGTVAVGMSESGGQGTITWTVRLDGGATPIYTTSGTAGTASFNWDTAAVAPGAHRLDLTVQDGGGRTATATRNVTVQQPVTGSIRVFITQPGADGATVSGTVWFTIWIENAAAGSKTYTLSVDGTVVDSTSTTSNGPVSMAWTSSGAPNGSHMATVTVRDSAGATGSAGRTLSVQN